MRKVTTIIRESISVKESLAEDSRLVQLIEAVVLSFVEAFRSEKKVLFCGNGGSAADAQHIAAELSGKFYFDRPPLYAEALHANTSYVTAIANDHAYDEIYSRAVRGAGRAGDVLVGITTSGNSPNIVKAVQAARNAGMTTVGMTGETGGRLNGICDFLINVPSVDTARIQEAHIMIGHIICELVEESLFVEYRG